MFRMHAGRCRRRWKESARVSSLVKGIYRVSHKNRLALSTFKNMNES